MTTIREACQWLEDLGLPTEIRESTWLFPTIETVHVLALVLVIGSISMLDLRLLGVAHRSRSVTQLADQMLPLTWSAFAVAASAGFLLFTSKAVTYVGNTPFRVKMICLLLAGANMLYFHSRSYHRVVQWNEGAPPLEARLAGGFSLLLWTTVVGAGRWIGFTT